MNQPTFTVHCGNTLDILKEFPSESIHCCVTSPPYYGLRDYGVEGQIGLEPTPQKYIDKLVAVFREVRRVLRSDGTLWVNIGDTYCSSGGHRSVGKNGVLSTKSQGVIDARQLPHQPRPDGVKIKDLIGIPWMLAFALRADGWYLRSEIIWHKPVLLPESVKDRPTKAHEQIFLLSKSPKYFYDADAIKEPFADQRMGNPGKYNWKYKEEQESKGGATLAKNGCVWNEDGSITGRNKRSVWTINTKPYKEAHFAVFPPEIPKTCLLAGSPEGGTVLDPFSGAATTGIVAVKHGRNYVGIELNPEYVEIGKRRYVTEIGTAQSVEELFV